MTKGSNLPYRRLCVELGARITVSEMTLARRLKQKRAGEFALIRRFSGEPCFGVQLATNKPDDAAWAAALVESRGADFVDMNFGCPIDYFTRKGLGAAIGRSPNRIRRLVEAMKRSVTHVPVTAKIRLGWNEMSLNYLDQARAAVDGGADALFVHGRTRNARYRSTADWDAIAAIVSAVPVPVIGNGDLLFPHEIDAARQRSGVAAVMVARAALIKPWIFREACHGVWDISAEERVAIYRRYAALAREHWGDDEHGMTRVRAFTRWHLDFWCRYTPRHADGTYPSMQTRDAVMPARSPLEALLAREDEQALAHLADCLAAERELDPAVAPPAAPPSGGFNGDRRTAGVAEVEG
ncbi:MAG TPA: tRNA-dihydrouridine synthase family protein [Vicinamibacterales bacterium]|nr:tRNA-dihydrouridine synthase family protein [Vicinamibacterales bacterium]